LALIRNLRVMTASALALAVICLADPAPGSAQQSNAPPDRVSGPEISTLIRSTMVAVHHANVTGNYTVLRDLGDNYFRTVNTAVRLGDVFRDIRESDIDLGETVLFDPFVTERPVISPNGVLQIEGFFPTDPLGIVFKMGFRHEFGRWRIFSLSIGAQPLEKLQAARRPAGQNAPEQGAPGDLRAGSRPDSGVILPREKPTPPQE
jgi:hypothetical protein